MKGAQRLIVYLSYLRFKENTIFIPTSSYIDFFLFNDFLHFDAKKCNFFYPGFLSSILFVFFYFTTLSWFHYKSSTYNEFGIYFLGILHIQLRGYFWVPK